MRGGNTTHGRSGGNTTHGSNHRGMMLSQSQSGSSSGSGMGSRMSQ
jgi:hypothetical protein